MSRIDMPHPTLAHVLRFVAALIRVPEGAIVRGDHDGAEEGRELFAWLACHVTDAMPDVVAFFVNLDPAEAERRRAAIDARRAKDRRFREVLDEAALELHVEAALVRRKALAGVPDRDAAVIARRVLAGYAVAIPADDLVQLAASYEALLFRIGTLQKANAALLAAAYTPGEKPARQKRDEAVRALFSVISDRPSREPFHA